MPTQIQIKRGSTTPAGLTVGEQAVNTSTNQIYLGGTGGTVWVGGEVTAGVDMGAGSAVSATRVPTQSGVYNYVRNNFVTSFNGRTGAVQGVSSWNGQTGAVSFVNYVASVNGATGAITNVAKTNVDNNFSASQTIETTGAFLDVLNSANNTSFSLQPGVGIVVSDSFNAPQTLQFNQDGIFTTTVTLPNFTTTLAGLSGTQTFTGTKTFSALTSFAAGISASGGVTLAGTLSGATATFSRLVTGNGGFSGDVNISSTNATGNMYLVMSRGAGVTALFVDSASTPLVYQPLQGNLGLKGITLASGTDVLYATPTQITATSTSAPNSAYFYFVSPTIYFQSGDTAAMAASGSTRQLTWGDFLNGSDNCYFGVNRAEGGMCGDYAVEINHSTGKALQLIYNDYSGAASNWVNMNVTSGGDLTITPSGGDVTVSGNLSADSFILSSGGIKALTGTTYSFLAADNGKIITMSNAGGITAAIPTGLPVGFSVTVIQLGAGQVGFSADAGVTLNSYNSLKKIIGQHGSASVVIYSSNTANLAGSLT